VMSLPVPWLRFPNNAIRRNVNVNRAA
jgi:hypothetical protein